ncbi:MAG: hypothetical protein GWP91_15225 [Rhodobacterales bacterium]|nr:hypothetical protein [Rhodobacterales bacterium]
MLPASSMRLATATLLALSVGACKGDSASDGDDDGTNPAGVTFPDYTPGFTVIAKAGDGLDKPQDLDFHPDADREFELWVVNKRTEDTGSDMVIIHDAGLSSQTSENRMDGNAWHFMNQVSAIAFSDDNGNWATSAEIHDANHSGTPESEPAFSGPSLWSSNLDVFARPSGGNGSHLDMLHQSPQAMGIAHDVDNAFWVFDGFADEIVWYDFVTDHGPGNDDHSDGKVKRYSDLPLKKIAGTPGHMVVDKSTDWLYICDPGNSQILRMDIFSGTKDFDLAANFESLAKHFQMKDEVWEVFADTNLQEPTGIDLDGELLYVTDKATGEIIGFSLETGEELGRIQTDAGAIMGIKVGPDGNLYYVDRKSNKVNRVDQN